MVLAAGEVPLLFHGEFPSKRSDFEFPGELKAMQEFSTRRALPKDCSSFVLKFYCGHQTQPVFYSVFSFLGIKAKVKESYRASYKN